MTSNNLSPLFIIGAARSGTNLVRDIITSDPKFITWPCDEINSIWRHHNQKIPTDLFTGEHANQRVVHYIQKQFLKLRGNQLNSVIVEKTCANTLRIPFLHKIFPTAKYINIIRDGRDVALSASKRWQGGVKSSYILKKLKYVPTIDLPVYIYKNFVNRVYQLLSTKNTVKSWGPIIPNMDEIFRSKPIEVASAIQWKFCVNKSLADLDNLCVGNVLTVKYEDLVTDTNNTLESVERFLNWKFSPSVHLKAGTIKSDSLNSHKSFTNQKVICEIYDEIFEVLKKLNYT